MYLLNTIYEDIECTFNEPLIHTYSLDYICLIKDDHKQSIKLKMFLKENIDYVTNNDLIGLLTDKISEYSETWNLLINFYDLLKQKFIIILKLKTWREIYINNLFWDLSTIDQLIFLIQNKNYFLSIYDCSMGGCVFHLKLMKILQGNKYNHKQIMEDIEDRLKRILKLVGPKIFEHLDLPLITQKQLYEFSNNQIINYFSIIFRKIKELFEETINLFKEFDLVCEELNNILNV
jgi:hypothetical protein